MGHRRETSELFGSRQPQRNCGKGRSLTIQGTDGQGVAGRESILGRFGPTVPSPAVPRHRFQPVALMLVQVLHFVPDSDDPYGIVARLMAALPPGSFLVMVHGASDLNSEVNAELTRRYNSVSSAHRRC